MKKLKQWFGGLVIRMPKHPLLPDGVSAHTAGGPSFVGPQEGPGAEILHAEFRAALAPLPNVERAYFCRVRYAGEERIRTAVCLASARGEDLGAVEAVAAAIRRNLGEESHIDILFLSAPMEQAVGAVCSPFYQRGEAQPEPALANGLFRCPIQVRRGPGCEAPANWSGAYVECFSAAADHLSAVRLASKKLAEGGWLFDDVIGGKVDQLDPWRWDEYLASVPTAWADHLPPRSVVVQLTRVGGVFFGPFLGSDAAEQSAHADSRPPS